MRVDLPYVRTSVVREKTVGKTSKKRFKVTAGRTATSKTATSKTATGKTAAAVLASDAPVEEEGEDPVSYFLGSRLPGPAEHFAQLIRGHWGGCEIRNHWVRDALWEEDKTRSGNWALNACLAIMRVALISVRFRQHVTLSWPRIFEQCAHSTVKAMSLINGKSIT